MKLVRLLLITAFITSSAVLAEHNQTTTLQLDDGASDALFRDLLKSLGKKIKGIVEGFNCETEISPGVVDGASFDMAYPSCSQGTPSEWCSKAIKCFK